MFNKAGEPTESLAIRESALIALSKLRVRGFMTDQLPQNIFSKPAREGVYRNKFATFECAACTHIKSDRTIAYESVPVQCQYGGHKVAHNVISWQNERSP